MTIEEAFKLVYELRRYPHRLHLKLSESEGRTGTSWAAVFRRSDGPSFVGQADTPAGAIELAAKAAKDIEGKGTEEKR